MYIYIYLVIMFCFFDTIENTSYDGTYLARKSALVKSTERWLNKAWAPRSVKSRSVNLLSRLDVTEQCANVRPHHMTGKGKVQCFQ